MFNSQCSPKISVVRIIFLFLIIFLFFFLLANFSLAAECTKDDECQKVDNEAKRTVKCINGKCVRALEITYPEIGGATLTEKVVAEKGLPGYIKYIFNFAVALIGFITFSVLIYNGIKYLVSAGSPAQMTEAKNGILYAFLGGLLLLFSVLLFNTINPQLTIFELPKIKPIEQVILPGVYLCNYNVNTKINIESALDAYINATGTEHNKAAKELTKAIVWDPDRNEGCFIVNSTGWFRNFEITKDDTIFIIPSISTDPKGKIKMVKYEYGIVLFEGESLNGRCTYYPKESTTKRDVITKSITTGTTTTGTTTTGTTTTGGTPLYLYGQIDGYAPKDLDFTARSVLLFQKLPFEPMEEGRGVTLYKDFNYNRDNPNATTTKDWLLTFKPDGDGDIIKVGPSDLRDLKEKTRSISFWPPRSYFALLFEGNNYDKRCAPIDTNWPNIVDVGIGLCGTGCIKPLTWIRPVRNLLNCAPCLRSMIVIKAIGL